MKFEYSINTRLGVRGIKSEELATVMSLAEDKRGYGPVVSAVYPEYRYDYDGNPLDKLGTYAVTFETQWWGSEIKDLVEQQREQLEEIEKSLTR